MPTKEVYFTFRCPLEFKTKLDEEAKKRDVSVGALIREFVEVGLDPSFNYFGNKKDFEKALVGAFKKNAVQQVSRKLGLRWKLKKSA